ncbi:hypothetical protein SUGI_0664600 [Cryptomeria japonica]|uniref:G-type lectin S-receptor-like serine/threonine-protein kinase At2g19130 n=1 Tax=Cryptomeria japonica TaxID=3369 RepID=UPI002414C8D7|nr:G-type lectin S-receptor-like serine/threonine-protein kinase At2g19130 [Cryptomeria japonica]GLJ33002.1 hypothetical protein SUGI_0664600 [Cryptomeria japonica]
MDWFQNAHSALSCLIYFFLALAMLISCCKCDLSEVTGNDALSLGDSLRADQTITSKNGTFEMGFFNVNGTNNWYVGIWYAQISEKTIIWVANRETPIRKTPGILMLSRDGYLTVSDSGGRQIWSTNDTQQTKASSASILDTGNFVLFGAQNTSEIVWESFAHPTDTMMPHMKFWKGLQLRPWKNRRDPAAGPFFLEINPALEQKDFILHYTNGVPYYSTGPWMGTYYATMPESLSRSIFQEDLIELSPTRMYYIYWFTPKAGPLMARQIVTPDGYFLSFLWIQNRWSMDWSQPQERCGVYGMCGAHGVCFTQANVQLCSCAEGFNPRDAAAWHSRQWWLSGCVRRTPLNCSAYINGSVRTTTDGFLQVGNISLSDNEAPQYTQEWTLQGCKTACLNNCSCTAFALTNSNPAVCKMWFGDLLSLRAKDTSSEGQSFFIRLAASDLQQSSAHVGISSTVLALSISSLLGIAALGILFVGVWLFIKRRRRRLLQKQEEYDTSTSFRTFTYRELRIATNNFAHKLGKGAFGSVFKGTLSDNTLVAVKKLEGSQQAEKQLRAEISTIGNIHHVNLVRLRGFCVEGSQRMLVYEYMQNGSLSSFLSRKAKEAGKLLDWNTRFGIALGTAKGLLYLHEECRDRIIHCDIKPENILLDADLSPKVADFGLAKLVGRDFSRVLTTTRGTRGYLAPEWLAGLPITVKADVYSFGMTLLEIISGRRNLDFSVEGSQCYFPTWAATQIDKGNFISIVDERVADQADVEQIRRAAVVSFLCIDKDESVRPSMGQVVLMLEGKSEADGVQFQRSLQQLVDNH